MPRRAPNPAWALASALLACVPHESGEPPPEPDPIPLEEVVESLPSTRTERHAWDCSAQPVESGRSRACRGCFHVDEHGLGECRLAAHRATGPEFVATLRHSATTRHSCKAWDDAVVFPLGTMLVEMARSEGFSQLADIKKVVRRPGEFGYPQLEGVEVRVNSGTTSTYEEWGGLKNILYVGSRPDDYRTCCTEPGCMGTDYRCRVEGPGRLDWCEPLSERAIGRLGFGRPGW